MAGAVRCVLLDPTDKVCHALRRYASETCPCSGIGYHNASVRLGYLHPLNPDDHVSGDLWPHDDPRWPAACGCGYLFQPGDAWQRAAWRAYMYPDTGALLTLQDVQPGHMWWADWLSGHHASSKHQARGNGPHLIVRLPDGQDWDVDAPSKNGAGWDRFGDPPLVTASPSILTDRYHGWLKNGRLVEC